jgi:hypothetical protein
LNIRFFRVDHWLALAFGNQLGQHRRRPPLPRSIWIPLTTLIVALELFLAWRGRKKRVESIQRILLKNPLGPKIQNLWGIISPCLYRKNPSTGILERRFLSSEYDFLQSWKDGVFQQNLFV